MKSLSASLRKPSSLAASTKLSRSGLAKARPASTCLWKMAMQLCIWVSSLVILCMLMFLLKSLSHPSLTSTNLQQEKKKTEPDLLLTMQNSKSLSLQPQQWCTKFCPQLLQLLPKFPSHQMLQSPAKTHVQKLLQLLATNPPCQPQQHPCQILQLLQLSLPLPSLQLLQYAHQRPWMLLQYVAHQLLQLPHL